jgi:Tol biopolymer transport system component
MGEVYRAHDARLRRDVAIKVLPDSFAADRDRLSRFEREAQILASLNCPNIAAIYGIEQAGESQALVLEYVDGATLADMIAGSPLPVPEALNIARQLIDALDAAHERGIVHRDLKPANIKITPDGIVKVLDFGLAKAPAAAASPDLSQSPTITSDGTSAGVLLGTAPYMSPEQARGRVVDKRTDIWAFGCVLYEMLTGRRAFAGATVSDVLGAILHTTPDWSLLPPATPPLVRRLLPRLLDADLKRRVRDIADIRVDLDDTWPAAAAPVIDRRAVWWRNAAIGAVAVIAIALAAVAPSFTTPAAVPPSMGRSVVSQLTSYGGTEDSGAIAPDGRAFVFVSEHGGTPDLWLRQIAGGDPVRLTDDAAIESEAVYAPDGESIYFTRNEGGTSSIWRILALGGQPRRVLTGGQSPSPSPDGRSLAWIRHDEVGRGSLVSSGVDGANVRVLAASLRSAFYRASWSHDGRRLAYTTGSLFSPRNLFIVEMESGTVSQVTHFVESSAGPQTVAWLRDNRHLVVSYVATPNSQGLLDLGVIDSESGTIARLTANLTDSLMQPTLSVDGRRVILTSRRFEREVWKVPFGPDPLANGRAAARLLDATIDPMWTYVTRDGQTLLYNNAMVGSRNLWVMPVDGSARARQITAVPGDAVMHSSLSPDGTKVAFASSATGNSEIWVQNIDGSDLRQLTSDAAPNSWPAWSPDGTSIMYSAADETWRVPAQGGKAEKILDGFFRGDWIRRPGSDGTVIATSLTGGPGIRLIDVERRAVLWQQETRGNGMPSFSPDGRWISYPYRESRERDAIWVSETATGKSRVAVRFAEPFVMFFRASWIDDGRAFLVNRYRVLTHIVMIDDFWQPTPSR